MVEVLKQGKGEPLPVARQVVMIYAGINGLLADVPVAKVKEFEQKLFSYIEREHLDLFSTIDNEKVISDQTDEKLKEVLAAFKESQPDLLEGK